MELVRKSDRWVATVSTVGFHVLLLLLFILYKLVTPIPPYPVDGGGGLGVELNFGDSESGMGMSNPEERSAPVKPQPPPQAQNAPLLTSDVEENNYVEPVRPKPKKPEPKELKRPDTGPRITKTDPAPAPPDRLYSGKKTGGSEGNTGKPGNQGKEDGDPYGKVYEGKPGSGGTGDGGPGSGGGSGGGDGIGTGPGRGSGISFNLGSRGSVSLPKPDYGSEKSGFVVVDITVDRNGNVIRVRAGAKGTTVQDAKLFEQAESAARRAKFRSDPSAPEQQHGTITYQFIRN